MKAELFNLAASFSVCCCPSSSWVLALDQSWLFIHSAAAKAVSEVEQTSASKLVMFIKGVCKAELMGKEFDMTGLVNLC